MVVSPPSTDDIGLVGRDGMLERLRAARAAGERLVVLTGTPGVGKSAIARAFAREASEDAVAHVARIAGSSTDEVLFGIARALGIRFVDEPVDAWVEIAACLSAPSAVLVLDGADDALDAVREIVEELRVSTEALLVVTSRRCLDVAGELVLLVPPLDGEAASRLFARAIARRNPAHGIPPERLARAAARLRGVPLALELVAMRAAKLGAAALDEASLPRAMPPLLVARTLEASFRALGPARADLLALSVFRGAFDLAAAEAVLGDDVEGRVSALVGASLVVCERGRFELPSLVRDEAARRARSEAPAVHRANELRHARHFARLVGVRADSPAAWAVLLADRDDFLAAFEALLSHGEVVEAAEVAVRLDPGLVGSGPAWQHRALLERAAAGLGGADAPGPRADLAVASARFFAIRGRHARALAILDGTPRVGLDPTRTGWIEAMRAFSLRPRGRLSEARAAGDAALAAALATGDLVLECAAVQIGGLVDLDDGALDAAARAFERAFGVARACGARRLCGIVAANASLTALGRARVDEAASFAADARAAFRAVRDELHLARVAILDARIFELRGAPEDADASLREALSSALANGDRDGEVDARTTRAELAHARRDAPSARIALEEARVALRTIDDVAARARLDTLARKLACSARVSLVVRDEGRSVSVDGKVVDLGRRGALRRLVLALVRCHRDGAAHALDVPAMVEAGWPGERMRPESGAARVYMAVRRLRALGLAQVLETRDEGYRLAPDVDVIGESAARASLRPLPGSERAG